MPGELGDEQEQPSVGYYEHRYQPNGEWMLDTWGVANSWREFRDKHPTKGILRRLLMNLKRIHEEKPNGRPK